MKVQILLKVSELDLKSEDVEKKYYYESSPFLQGEVPKAEGSTIVIVLVKFVFIYRAKRRSKKYLKSKLITHKGVCGSWVR